MVQVQIPVVLLKVISDLYQRKLAKTIKSRKKIKLNNRGYFNRL